MKRHCLERGCPDYALSLGRCQRHAKQRNKDTHSIERKRVYNSKRWKLLCRATLTADPWCAQCKSEGIETLAVEVDHIVAMQDGGDPWHHSNVQGLCRKHHGRKTRDEQRRRSR